MIWLSETVCNIKLESIGTVKVTHACQRRCVEGFYDAPVICASLILISGATRVPLFCVNIRHQLAMDTRFVSVLRAAAVQDKRGVKACERAIR